ncbi:MAG: porin [Betaproteobacteria bacterium]|nr:porin [Betaproteobacteria bacterium]
MPLSIGSAQVGNATSFWRRQNNSLHYHTPNWGGFKGMFTWSSSEERAGGAGAAAAASPRLWSLGATYINGPLSVGAGYERHNDYNPAARVVGTAAGQYNGGTDTAWNISAAYTFAGIFRLGGVYERLSYDVAVGQNLDRNAWGLFGDWKIQGPHSLRLGYVRGNSAGGNATGINVNSIASPLTAAGAGQSGGANMWMIRYAYGFSKRTEVNLGYSQLNNDTVGRYRIHAGTRNAGQDQRAWGVGLWHSF